MKIFSIETSCDETAAAIVENGSKLLASSIASSRELHEKTGGVVPEIAARKQVESIVPVMNDVMEKFREWLGESEKDLTVERLFEKHIDAIAVTVGPGLIGSLIVGVEAAKALSLALDKPLIPVNHLIGHIYGNFVDSDFEVEFPMLALVVSGGHTDLVLMKDHYDIEYIGGTLDDAAGEAFDKTARLLGISKYLGGALLSKEAAKCNHGKYSGVLPRPMLNRDGFDFSFSGLKTAVKVFVEKNKDVDVCCLSREFEDAVVEVLVAKTIKAAKENGVKTVLLGGGVSANTTLRERLAKEGEKKNLKVYFPKFELCTDNAIYIASAAYFLQKKVGLDNFKGVDYSKVRPDPSLGITDESY
jgi:N6-L-threonylcarbamoyladenine synthase